MDKKEALKTALQQLEKQYGKGTVMDSPDIDGLVYFEDANAREGDFISVDIIDAEGCDLYGRAIQEETRV